MIRVVHLRGPLRKLTDGPIRIEAESVRELIEALTRQIRGFRPSAKRGRKSLSILGYSTFEDLFRKLKDDEREFHIFPALFGAKGFFQVLIGAVLIAASFIPGLNVAVASAVLSLGVGMALGGLTQLLFPAPSVDRDDNAVEQSKYLPASGNTTASGTRIPLVYGAIRVGGHYLSFDVDAIDRGI